MKATMQSSSGRGSAQRYALGALAALVLSLAGDSLAAQAATDAIGVVAEQAVARAKLSGSAPAAASGLTQRSGAPEKRRKAVDPDEGQMPMSLLEAVEQLDGLSAFLTLVEAAELTEYLDGIGSYTILAPHNSAFAYLRETAINSRELVRNFVLRHVAPGRHTAAELAKRGFVSTLRQDQRRQGFRVKQSDGQLVIGDAWVVTEDVEAPNGVIHVLSRSLKQPAARDAR